MEKWKPIVLELLRHEPMGSRQIYTHLQNKFFYGKGPIAYNSLKRYLCSMQDFGLIVTHQDTWYIKPDKNYQKFDLVLNSLFWLFVGYLACILTYATLYIISL